MNGMLFDLIDRQASRAPESTAVVSGKLRLGYGEVARQVRAFSGIALELGLQAGERIGVFLEIRVEAVVAMFGAAAAGCVFVPINALYRDRHVRHILRDCNIRVLVTTAARLRNLGAALNDCHDLHTVILVDGQTDDLLHDRRSLANPIDALDWQEALAGGAASTRAPHRRINEDMTAIFYTSGSTGMPKGVVQPHRSMMIGADSVCGYLNHSAEDRFLAVIPLSFDAGFIQLTTTFYVGARVTLLNYLLPRDVINAVTKGRITGFTGVPPLFNQLSQVPWPDTATESLRYIASTGGVMPRATLDKLRRRLPKTQIVVNYGMTEAFRSTYLPPEQLKHRPSSMGKAIPNAEVLVVKEDGRLCGPGEEGELVHRGALVTLGYWNNPEETAKHFRPAPGQTPGLYLPSVAMWSGDIVRMDDEGYLYFVGRRDDQIKTSGNRVSPTEVEEVIYGTDLVAEAVCFGAPHPTLGQGIVVVASSAAAARLDIDGILAACRRELPSFMVPHAIVEWPSLPRNANGKIDRARVKREVADIFNEESQP